MTITYSFGADKASQTATSEAVEGAIKALQNADDALKGGTATAALHTWFGASITAKSDRIEKLQFGIRTMRACLNSWNVNINYQGSNAQLNAAAFPPTFRTAKNQTVSNWAITQAVMAQGGSKMITLPGGDTIQPPQGTFNISVYGNFIKMNLAGSHLTTSAYQQDRIETLIHEVSHAIVGTKDQQLHNGTRALGRQWALALVAEEPDKAFDNAENWGMFCAALRQ